MATQPLQIQKNIICYSEGKALKPLLLLSKGVNMVGSGLRGLSILRFLDKISLCRKGRVVKCGGFMNDIIFIVCTITWMITI